MMIIHFILTWPLHLSQDRKIKIKFSYNIKNI
jgi:hypothetical protein